MISHHCGDDDIPALSPCASQIIQSKDAAYKSQELQAWGRKWPVTRGQYLQQEAHRAMF
jgi:hypothetical protein